jgi:hypothetical protein
MEGCGLMHVDERVMQNLGFDYDVANLFSQGEELSRQPVETIAYAEEFIPYEMNEAALIKLDNGSFIIIHAVSCSCWPSMGDAEIYEGDDELELIASFRKNIDRHLGEQLLSEYRSN